MQPAVIRMRLSQPRGCARFGTLPPFRRGPLPGGTKGPARVRSAVLLGRALRHLSACFEGASLSIAEGVCSVDAPILPQVCSADTFALMARLLRRASTADRPVSVGTHSEHLLEGNRPGKVSARSQRAAPCEPHARFTQLRNRYAHTIRSNPDSRIHTHSRVPRPIVHTHARVHLVRGAEAWLPTPRWRTLAPTQLAAMHACTGGPISELHK